MKKYIFFLLMSLLITSCSQKVEVKGTIKNAHPIDRVAIIEASEVATLPLVSIPVNSKGTFSGKFSAPKNGMYVLTYGRSMNIFYMKKGQTFQLLGESSDFPQKFQLSGDAKANNDFLKKSEEFFQNYATTKVNMEAIIKMDEASFLKEFKKIQDELMKSIKEEGKKYKADNDVIDYKSLETKAKLVGLFESYEQFHGQSIGQENFKFTSQFTEFKKELNKDSDIMMKEIPIFREYRLGQLMPEFKKFAEPKMASSPNKKILYGDLFGQFLKQRRELSTVAKDYLYAYMISQSDINPQNSEHYKEINKLINDNIANVNIKIAMMDLQKVIMGFEAGSVVGLQMQKKDGSDFNLTDLKGKHPTVVMFYASYNPNIAIATTPILKEISDFYKNDLDFAYVNLDDTKGQFEKTSSAMLKGFVGENYYVNGGINSSEAKKFGLYTFKLPYFVILDKEGKLIGRQYMDINDPEFILKLEELTGKKSSLSSSLESSQLMPPPPMKETPATPAK